ncbi:MAG TPA: adenylosuccinate synthetase [Micromonosporaceae bacterium]|nr:adenylosuccinate synthetase [Micromonosporaceae bacterium]
MTGRHTVVVDLGYGDAGKGTVVDWLCASRPVHAVIRFNGGPQAAHNVVLPDGRHHTFAQFGSGTLAGARTHLSRFMLVDPLALAREADHLRDLGVADPYGGLTVDRDALLVTPYHGAANRERERRRGDARHGSCGMGVGETMAYSIGHPDLAPRVGDTASPYVLRRKLVALRDAVAAEFGELDVPPVAACVEAFRLFADRVVIVDGDALRVLLAAGECVFEGAQGVLLDEWRGFHPYTTWSTTTVDNAMTLLADAGAVELPRRVGVVRTYTTRHGAGPLVTEDATLTAALPDTHNGTGAWQGRFRVGHFDAVAHRYAVEVSGGLDALAVTHADVALGRDDLRVCEAYRVRVGDPGSDGAGGRTRTWSRIEPGPFTDLGYQEALTRRVEAATPLLAPAPADLPAAIGDMLGLPVDVVSWGPGRADKHAPGRMPAGV